MSHIIRTPPSRSEQKSVEKLMEKSQAEERARLERKQARLFDRIRSNQLTGQCDLPEAPPGVTDPDSLSRLDKAREVLFGDKIITNMKEALPLLFNLMGKPYSIDNHFPFEPFYGTRLCRNMVWKTGRQVAKTGRADSKFNHVYDKYGRRYRLAEVEPGQEVQSFDTNTFRSRTNRVLFQYDNPVKTCYYIRTRRGAEMELAGTHPLYTDEGWTPVDDLDVGDRIVHVRKGGVFGRKRVDERRIRITAYMLGDGSFRGDYSFTANRRTQAIAEMRKLLGDYREYRKQGTKANSLKINRDHVLHGWAKEDDLHGKLSHEKNIPEWVFLLSKSDTRTFIERLWATDGSVKRDGNKSTITYCSTSRELVYDLKSLLAKFGIPVAIKEKTGHYKKPDGRKVKCRQYWRLRLETREGWQIFLGTFDVPDKPGFELPDANSNNNRYTAPIEICELITDLAGECRGRNRQQEQVQALAMHGLRRKPKHPPSQEKLRRYLQFFRKHRAEHPRLAEFEKYVNRDADWDEIVEIRNVGDHKCADIEVEDTHCYLFDGILSHNSTNQACQGVLLSNLIPWFNTLFVTPQFELIRRFSTNYVQPFIMESPVKGYFLDSSCSNNVLQRTFRNRSIMYFSFAMLDCDRTRGLNCSKVAYDEVQDLDPSFIPIIAETMSASPWGLSQFTGTPKTLDGTLEQLWLDSSMAEWAIPCSCGRVNIPSLDQDLDAMLGPISLSRTVSAREPGVVCAKCGKPINPRDGWWHHLNEEKRFSYSGYHVPQLIMPMHYADPEKWAILQGKRMGLGRTSKNIFYNECCGESYDLGSKLLTVTDLKRAATLHPNTMEDAKAVLNHYTRRVLAVDWGGGGENEISFTTAACLGWRADGKIDVIFGWRSLTPNNPVLEAMTILKIMAELRCAYLVDDFAGAGALRETLIAQAGLPEHLIIPVAYQRVTAGAMMQHKPYNINTGKRAHHLLDKTRSLQYTAELIKSCHVRFFRYDYRNPDEAGLLHDFLSLIEDKLDSRMAQGLSTIIRNKQAGPDDFAHAVNMGVCALCHAADHWPDIASLYKLKYDQSVLNTLSPIKDVRWSDWPT